MTTITERRAQFRALHRSGCFVIPNPWDGGSAVRMKKAGFKALASTSAGVAWALGKDDGELTLDEALEHLRFLVQVTDLPVNADFEAGFSDTTEGVGETVARCVETGVAGVSIEDWRGGAFFPKPQAVARLKAARAAIDRSGQDVLLIGRCELFRTPKLELSEVIERLKAYGDAGADVLYAPGLKDLDEVAQVVGAVDKPVNVLLRPGMSIDGLAAAGVRRISLGGFLAHVAYAEADRLLGVVASEGRLP